MDTESRAMDMNPMRYTSNEFRELGTEKFLIRHLSFVAKDSRVLRY